MGSQRVRHDWVTEHTRMHAPPLHMSGHWTLGTLIRFFGNQLLVCELLEARFTLLFCPRPPADSQQTVVELHWIKPARRRKWHPTPVLLLGKSHGRRSLVGCSPWDREESDTTERLHFHFLLSCIGEGNGNPLQCSCLENPRDGEPGGLPSMGSHRVGHDWSDLAAAAATSQLGIPCSLPPSNTHCSSCCSESPLPFIFT